jgi:hypothetical protein
MASHQQLLFIIYLQQSRILSRPLIRSENGSRE